MIDAIRSFVKIEKPKLLVLFGCIQLQALILLAFPFVNVLVYDDLAITRNIVMYAKVSILVILLLAVFCSTSVLLDVLMAEIKSDCVVHYRAKLMASLLRKRYSCFISGSPGDVVQKIIPDVDVVADSFVKIIYGCFFSVQSLVLFCGLYIFDRLLFTVFFVLFSAYGIWVYFWNSKIKMANVGIGKCYGDLYGLAYETIQGVKDVKLFNRYQYILERLNRAGVNLREKMVSSSRIYSLQALSNTVIPWVGYLTIIGVCMMMGDREKYSVGVLVSILSLMWRLLSPIDKVTDAIAKYQEGNNALGRINIITQMEVEKSGLLPLSNQPIDIVFKGVSFQYGNGREVLNSVDCEIPYGKKIAIIGSSGSGKSTLISLLSCVNTGYAGKILINGKDLSEYQIDDVRDRLAIVSQDVFLFNDSLRSNILLGGVDDQNLLNKLYRDTRLDSMVEALPEKDGTVVGDRGLLLSGGERQRVAICRVLQKDPSIVILDEGTSALDEVTERAVWELVQRVFHGRTIICITHRMSLIDAMDFVYEFVDGRLALVAAKDSR